jgi:hypothetical protein
MNIVNVNLLVELINDEDNSNPFFNEGWTFSVDRYNFKKISDTELEVSFCFEADLTDKDEQGHLVQEIPSQETEEFQKYEEELNTILDLLSLTTSRGIRIKSGSYQLSAPGIGDSNRLSNKIPVSLRDSVALQKQYEAVKKENNVRLISGLRSYRLFESYEDPGDRITKLWSIIERVLGDEGGKILSEDKVKELTSIIEKWTDLTKEEKYRLIGRLKDTHKKSLLDSLAEGLDLMTAEGILSVADKKKMLSAWHKKRSTPVHGAILPKRDEEVVETLWEMESTVEGILHSRVTPKMIFYVVFNKNHVDKDFYERQGELLSKLKNDICALAYDNKEFEYFKGTFASILLNNNVALYFVTHDKAYEVKKGSFKEVNILDLDKYLMKVIGVLQIKINNIK